MTSRILALLVSCCILQVANAAKCKRHERFVQCPAALCVPQNCTELGYPVRCPIIGPDQRCPGSSSCVCIEGYLRNSKGVCVPQKQCPSCASDPNAEAGCGFLCGRRCSNTSVPSPCPCELNGCQCKCGFVYDDNIGKCVRPNKCSPQCGKNEVWNTCANGGCGKWNCTQIDEPDLCIDPLECKGGCVCKTGYLRSRNGTCINEEQCRNDLCPNPNEEYVQCPRSCDVLARSCDQQFFVVLCQPDPPQLCGKSTCLCKSGLYRDYKDDCVPFEDCPTCKQRDEIFVKCPEAVQYPTTCSEVGFPLNRPSVNNCPGKPGCICRGGYVRNCEGNCMPASECPSCGGDPNATQGCGTNCGKLCSDVGKPKPDVCPVGCSQYGCDCKDGYYYDNSMNKCVRPEQCPKTPTTNPIDTGTCSNATLPALINGSVIFTCKIFKEAYQLSPKSNNIMSPFSMLVPIGILTLVAEGETYNQLIKVLNVNSKNELRCLFPILSRRLTRVQNVVLNLAASIFARNSYPLNQSFVSDARNVFNAQAESLDFNNPDAAAAKINQWVESQTNNRIKNIAKPEMITDATRLFVANAVYFLGNWVHQFNSNLTRNRDFHVDSNTTIQVPTMFQESSFKYGEDQDLDSKILQMDYKGEEMSFVAIVPNNVDGLSTLIDKLQDPSALYRAYDGTSRQKVMVFMPKLRIESEFNLKTILNKVGITDIFEPGLSKLNNILEKYEPLYVSTAIHKSFGIVNENGTEAAAANVIGVSTTSIGAIFEANKPFVFYIFHNLFRLPIFCANIVKP